MSQVQLTVNQCDVCGHLWIPKPSVVYTHCTSSKCRSRKWNKGEQAMLTRALAAEDELATLPVRLGNGRMGKREGK